MHASEVMTRNIVMVGRDTRVLEAIRLMVDDHISAPPVTDEAGRLLGILT